MLTRNLMGLMVLLFYIGVTVQGLHATPITPDINIEDEKNPSSIAKSYIQHGDWNVIHSGGATYSCPSDSSKSYTVSGTPTATGDDSNSPDYVMFHNATITADVAEVCGHIYFWKKVSPGPSGTVDFDLFTNGALRRGNGGASGSWVHISGWVQHPSTPQAEADGVSGSWEHVGSLTGPPVSAPALDKHANAFNFSFINSIDEDPDLTGFTQERILKGEIWFFLKNQGDQLILNNGTGAKVQMATGAGDSGDINSTMRRLDDLEMEFIERLQRIEDRLRLPPLPRPAPGPGPIPGP